MELLKINKQKYYECLNYIAQINKKDLKELDLSEFVKFNTNTNYEEFAFSGLNNVDIIYMIDHTYDLDDFDKIINKESKC